MKEQLIDLEMYIEAYNDTAPNDGHALNEILKKIAVTLCYLEKPRTEYKLKFERKIYELTKDKKHTVSRAVNIAEVEVPELYLLRRIMDSAYRVCDVIRTNISFLKSEKNYS